MPEFVYQSPHAGQDVFILGAGFSKAISDQMPLLSELTAAVLDRIEGTDYDSVPYIHSNFELAMTFLSQRQPWLSEADYLRNRALALEIAQAIAAEIADRSAAVRAGPIPGWLVRFVHWLHARQAVIITLNYDTLLEAAFSTIETDGPQSPLAPQLLVPFQFAVDGSLGPTPAPTAELLKLHGSANWLYSGRASFFGEQLHYRWLFGWSRNEEEIRRDLRPTSRIPLIVPPVSDKTGYFENEDVQFLWKRAAAALRRAQRVFCVGYSLPETDLTMRFLLRSHPDLSSVDLYVVDRSHDTFDRFELLIRPTPYRIHDDYVGAGPIPRLADDLASGVLDTQPRTWSGRVCDPGLLLGWRRR